MVDGSYKLQFETVQKLCFSVPLSFYCWAKERKGCWWNFPVTSAQRQSAAEVSYRARTRNESEAVRPTLANESPNREVWLMCCECECGRVCVCARVLESVSRKRESGSCVIGQLRPDRSLTPSRHRDRILHPGQLSHKLVMHEPLRFCWRCATVSWWERRVLEGAGEI